MNGHAPGAARPLRQHLLFGLINFALTAPGIYLWIGLPLVMRQHGWSGAQIGLFQLAALPAVFKLLLAMPVQLWRPGRRPLVHWAWLTGAGHGACLLALATLDVEAPKVLLFALIMGASLFSTWADVPVNALAIRLFAAPERPLAGSIRSAATFAGAVAGGGAMLLVQQAWGWAAPLIGLATCLLLALALLGLVDERRQEPSQAPTAAQDWLGFFRQAGAGRWTLLLATYYPPVAVAWIYLKPLLLDRGFAPGEVAWIVGIGGSALGALTSLATGLMPRRWLAKGLRWSCAGNACALALLSAAAWQGSAAGLLGAALLLAIVLGVASSLAFASMMDFAREDRQAVDYGLQSSIFTLGRVLAAAAAGALLDRLGHAGMLALCAALAAMVWLLMAAQAWPVALARIRRRPELRR